jgi:hypothetical protein
LAFGIVMLISALLCASSGYCLLSTLKSGEGSEDERLSFRAFGHIFPVVSSPDPDNGMLARRQRTGGRDPYPIQQIFSWPLSFV